MIIRRKKFFSGKIIVIKQAKRCVDFGKMKDKQQSLMTLNDQYYFI